MVLYEGRQDPKTDPDGRPDNDKLRSLRPIPRAGSEKEMSAPKGQIQIPGRQSRHNVAPCRVVVIVPVAAIQFPMRRIEAIMLISMASFGMNGNDPSTDCEGYCE